MVTDTQMINTYTHTHTLRTVFFFGDRSSTRFCDSIPDVFCREKETKQREGVGYCFDLFASLLKALWEPGQRYGQRWTQECHKHSQGRVTIMTSEACTHKHPCIHTHMTWKNWALQQRESYLLACLWCGLSSLDRKLNCSILGMSLTAAQAWMQWN